jgi:hypothetical protein
LNGIQEVSGSTPLSSTLKRLYAKKLDPTCWIELFLYPFTSRAF